MLLALNPPRHIASLTADAELVDSAGWAFAGLPKSQFRPHPNHIQKDTNFAAFRVQYGNGQP